MAPPVWFPGSRFDHEGPACGGLMGFGIAYAISMHLRVHRDEERRR